MKLRYVEDLCKMVGPRARLVHLPLDLAEATPHPQTHSPHPPAWIPTRPEFWNGLVHLKQTVKNICIWRNS